VAKGWADFPWTREICCGDSEAVWHARLQAYGNTHGYKLKKIDASKLEGVDPTLYRQLIGSLMYLVNTRPDLCFAVNTLSQFMVEPKRVHWVAAKHVLRYLCGTIEFGLSYIQGNGVKLVGYSDADWAGNIVNRKSTSGCVFSLGSGLFLGSAEAKVSCFEFCRG
jgi:hypothetical protein